MPLKKTKYFKGFIAIFFKSHFLFVYYNHLFTHTYIVLCIAI